ncbi:hypothetical protein STEG23_016098, partial [Scotinomys teguina]
CREYEYESIISDKTSHDFLFPASPQYINQVTLNLIEEKVCNNLECIGTGDNFLNRAPIEIRPECCDNDEERSHGTKGGCLNYLMAVLDFLPVFWHKAFHTFGRAIYLAENARIIVYKSSMPDEKRIPECLEFYDVKAVCSTFSDAERPMQLPERCVCPVDVPADTKDHEDDPDSTNIGTGAMDVGKESPVQ